MTGAAERLAVWREGASARWARSRSGSPPLVLVGAAMCGRSAGALETLAAIRDEVARLGVDARVAETGCMGHCYAEPLVTVHAPGWPPALYHRVGPGLGQAIVQRHVAAGEPILEHLLGALGPSGPGELPQLADMPRYGGETRRLLARCGVIDPTSVDEAVAEGSYAGLARALDELSPEELIDQVRRAGIRGLGGAGFPTWRKWLACRRATGDGKTVICNADEGDPGAFMDRTLLESDPHLVLEGMALAALAVGSSRGIVYVRAEYPLAAERVGLAIEQARGRGVLGERVLGTGVAFDVEVELGAGAFICGESSALMRSIEGRRGVPRVRPPQSTERGLGDRPTVLNNVKTFAAASLAIARGPEAFAALGAGASRGTALFALAGKVVGTGLVEVPMGTSLRRVIFDIGGGVPRRRTFKAAQIGGPSGGCLPASELDTPVDFDSLARAGAMMGSGGLVVLDDQDCMVDVARYFLEFTQRESCGACTFCRIGTRHLLDLLAGLAAGRGRDGDLELLEALSREVADGSLCNLGKTAPNPVLTTLRHFREEYEAHLRERRCPAKVCRALIRFEIDPARCQRSCEVCVLACPTKCIATDARTRTKRIDQAQCVKCGACQTICPPEYDAVVRISPVDAPAPWEGTEGGEGS
jgi:NADH-quinone oxidoreductase subunit F